MKNKKKILVPVQIENISNDQLDIAAAIAKRFNSSIIILCVLPLEAKSEKINKILESYVKEELKKIAAYIDIDKNKIHQLIEYGNSFEKIISISETENVNIIIHVNQHDDAGDGEKIDNLSEKLIRKSIKPAMIVKPGKNIPPKKILCPVDYSESSERALNNAIKIARVFNSKLYIINVFEPLQESFSTRLNIDYNKENKKRESENKEKFNQFLKNFNLSDLDHQVVSLSGKPDTVITDFARTNSIDIIFI